MNWDEFKEGLQHARRTFNIADSMADELAKLLVGRLRKVGPYSGNTLRQLKMELKDYNMHTGKWK